jgi:hypothetical protein
MAGKSEDAKARAEAKFRKQEDSTREADLVHAENAANARAFDKKTAGLKAQRLAKETADAADRRTSKPDGGHARGPERKRKPKLIADPDEAKGG